MSSLVFTCHSNFFGYSTNICKCLFHENSLLQQKLVASVDGIYICRAICLHADFVNDPLLCAHRRQNSSSSVYYSILLSWGKIDTTILWAGKIRSKWNTGQYAGSISPGLNQGQTLVEPLVLLGVARHINKFLRKTTQNRGSEFAIHTSGPNCHWLKVVIALKVMIFLAFCNLSFCGCKTSLSGRVFIV